MTPFEYVSQRSRELFADPAEVRGPRRFRRLARIRAQISRELRGEPFKLSFPEIGKALGGRDHTSIIWYLRGMK